MLSQRSFSWKIGKWQCVSLFQFSAEGPCLEKTNPLISAGLWESECWIPHRDLTGALQGGATESKCYPVHAAKILISLGHGRPPARVLPRERINLRKKAQIQIIISYGLLPPGLIGFSFFLLYTLLSHTMYEIMKQHFSIPRQYLGNSNAVG